MFIHAYHTRTRYTGYYINTYVCHNNWFKTVAVVVSHDTAIIPLYILLPLPRGGISRVRRRGVSGGGNIYIYIHIYLRVYRVSCGHSAGLGWTVGWASGECTLARHGSGGTWGLSSHPANDRAFPEQSPALYTRVME